MFPQPRLLPDDAGTTTVEYAIGMVIAAVLAGVLLAVVKGDMVLDAVTGLIEEALSVDL